MQKLVFLFLFIYTTSIFSQDLSYFPIDFTINDIVLKSASAGGLDLPQFSMADLDNDGQEDLYVFDKLGNVHLGFLYNDNNGEADYIFDFGLTKNFPPLREWVLLKDFNQDGAIDIFGYSDIVGVDGIQVYQGFWNDGQLDFMRFEFPDFPIDLIPIANGSNLERIEPSKFDFPAIDDLDDDGDLDILAFGSMSNYVEFYENQSVEMGYGLDSLIFNRADICWGKFAQDPVSAAIITSDDAESCAYNSPNLNAIHTIASSLITLNLDGDDDKDLLFTNFENNEMLSLFNTGNSTSQAHITSIEPVFQNIPFPDIPPFIATPFHLDINQDGKRDMMISNFVFGRESYEVGWFFENVQTDEHPVFELQQTDFLTIDMLDFGTGAHPEFIDYNADGLLDLVVGNVQKWEGENFRTSSLQLFLNIGTSDVPQYELFDNDWLNFGIDTLFHSGLAPTFGDLDGDGDQDLLVGEGVGRLHYFENTADANNTLSLVYIDDNFMNINTDVFFGAEISPQIVDVNNDGLLDLLIGEREGNLNYFQNTGTTTLPEFDPNPENAPNTNTFGGIDFNFPGSANGSTSPFLFQSGNDVKLLVGSENIGTKEFTNISNNLTGNFTEVDGAFMATTRQGNFQNPALADVDADGFLEMVLGNMRGGITFFKTGLPVSGTVATNQQFLNDEVILQPNPFNDQFSITFKEENLSFETLEIFNLNGQLLKSVAILGQETLIDLQNFPAGTYILKTVGTKGIWTSRIVKI